MTRLSPDQLENLLPAETSSFPSPIPTQFVSSDEFTPPPQTAEAEAGRGAHQGAWHQARQAPGAQSPRVLPDRGRHGGGLRRDERRLRPDLRRQPGGSGQPRYGQRARQGSGWPVHHGHAHPLPARRHAAREFRAIARGGGQGGLESCPGRQAADPRGSEVRQLLQGNLLRQRHQGRPHLGLRLGRAARLVPHQRDEGGGARQGQPAHRLAAPDVARHLHAGHAGLDGGGGPGHHPAQARLVQGLHSGR